MCGFSSKLRAALNATEVDRVRAAGVTAPFLAPGRGTASLPAWLLLPVHKEKQRPIPYRSSG